MTRRTRQLASRRTAAAMIAAALLLSGEACAQPSSGGPLSFFDNIFTGSLSKGSQSAASPQRPGATAQAQATPATSNPAPPWSREDGAPGHPFMTASAIREAAANFENCDASVWLGGRCRHIPGHTFVGFTRG